MKYIVLSLMLMLSCGALSARPAGKPKVSGDTVIVVTVTPPMHCANCEKKIKNNIRFVKGVRKIETDVEKQTVTITADKSRIRTAELEKAFSKIGYRMK